MRSSALAAVLVLTACGDPSNDDPADPGSTGETASTSSNASSAPGPLADTTATAGDSEASTDPTEGPADPTEGFPPPVLDECIDDGSAGDHVYTCGALRYDVTIPDACLEQACGLIFDVHGYTMSGAMEEANTSLRALGSARGYIVVQPNANPAPPASSWNPGIDDDAVLDFMQRMASSFHVDPDRLHFTGFSQGGYMSWRMVCGHADLLASVAPASACGGSMLDDCTFGPGQRPREPVDILYLHGTQDVLVPYPCAPMRRDAVVAALGLGPEEVVTETEGYRWTRHTGPDGTELELITHEYSAANTVVLGGHCYPGSEDPGTIPGQLFSYACVEATDLHWGTAVLDFFDAHPKG